MHTSTLAGTYQHDYKQFKIDLLEAYNLVDHPKKDMLFLKAWNLGAKYTYISIPGYEDYDQNMQHSVLLLYSVLCFFEDLSELLT